MNAEEIETNDKMNTTVKETLELRGDNMSLYALKRIMELESQLSAPKQTESKDCNCSSFRWEVRSDGNRYCVMCGENKTNN